LLSFFYDPISLSLFIFDFQSNRFEDNIKLNLNHLMNTLMAGF
jgi:hypothetical protein